MNAKEMAREMFAEPDAHALVCWISERLPQHRAIGGWHAQCAVTAEREVLAVIEAYQRGLLREDREHAFGTIVDPPVTEADIAGWHAQYAAEATPPTPTDSRVDDLLGRLAASLGLPTDRSEPTAD